VTVGEAWTIARLVAELLKDRDFFDDSGGGITLSGGEPMGQHAFLATLLPELKAADLHITLETSGVFAWRQIEPLLPHLDLIYFDLKHMDPEAHAALTGADNRRIRDNFTRLAAGAARLQARMPLVPGVNDDEANLRATARFLRTSGHDRIHCLPYHHLGEAKLGRIQTPLQPLGLAPTTAADRQRVGATFAREGIYADIYD
jgi:pyruvate formate lyase activating enzyme